MSSIDREFIKKVPSLVKNSEIAAQINATNNAELLPYLFRVKGEPFSLKDRPQFDAQVIDAQIVNAINENN